MADIQAMAMYIFSLLVACRNNCMNFTGGCFCSFCSLLFDLSPFLNREKKDFLRGSLEDAAVGSEGVELPFGSSAMVKQACKHQSPNFAVLSDTLSSGACGLLLQCTSKTDFVHQAGKLASEVEPLWVGRTGYGGKGSVTVGSTKASWNLMITIR